MAGKGGGAQKAAKQARKLLKMDSSGAGLGDTADYGPVNGGTVNTSPGVLARDDPGNYNSSGTTPLATPPLKGKAKRQYLKTLPKGMPPGAGMAPPGMPPGPPPMMPPGMAAMPPNPFTPQPMQPMPWGGGDMTRQRFLAQLMGPGGPMAGMSA
jgi:hypothetical protein